MARQPAAPTIGPFEVFDLTWAPWIESQRQWFDAGVEQWSQMNRSMTTSWIALLETWWAPWTPFLERGGEQLA